MTLTLAARSRACGPGCRGVHSYAADGRRACWQGEGEAAIDAELAAQPVPPALAARFPRHASPAVFWPAWTRAEALAKLAGVPILLWLRQHGLDADAPVGVRLSRHDRDGLVIALAERVARGREAA